LILLAFDLETTGLDFVKDRPIEVGAILYSTGQQRCLESQGFLVKTDVPISAEITDITGITKAAVDKFGFDSKESLNTVYDLMLEADAVIGHNVVRFDKRMFENWCQRDGLKNLERLWVDTYTDLPGAKQGTLTHMAADHGILNLFPHGALTDCLTVLKLLEKYDILKVVERAQSPTIGIQAHQSRNNNEQAKKLKFRWNPELKIWYKLIKEMDLNEHAAKAPFDVSVLGKETFEQIRDL
jgi:DNA polymerase III epsilon subunit-like protein